MSETQDAIARRAESTRADASAREYLAFDLGAAHYALPLPCVREIVRVPLVTEVPRSPSHVLGVISVRGAVTTVFDLRVKLQLVESPLTSRSRILLIDGGREVVGLLVDNVLQVYRLLDGEIELSTVLGSESPPYLFGIGRPEKAARAVEHAPVARIPKTSAARKKAEAAKAEAPKADAFKPGTAADFLLLLDPVVLLRSESHDQA